ncbi:MAG: hypothetical protein Q9201_000201 [Fulgogasparrea decipioides]
MADDHFRAPEDSAEYEELFDAASDGDIKRLEAALLPSMNVNALQADVLQGHAALHKAAQSGNVTAIHFLLAHGAKVDLSNAEGETPLHEAAFWAHPKAIEALLNAGADISLPTGDDDYTALHNVLKYKDSVTAAHIETIELLLDGGLDPNAKADGWGSTLVGVHLRREPKQRGARLEDDVLLSAADDYNTAKFLLDRGAKISPSGRSSAITNAAGGGNTKVVRLLISHANDMDIRNSRDAVHWAAAGGRIDVIKLLLENNFDVNTNFKGCEVGETPLLATCEFRKLTPERLAVAKLLIERGADINACSEDGRTAAELLLQSDSSGLLQDDTELKKLLATSRSV